MKEAINEKELLKGLARNDKNAVETIYREHYKIIQTLIINNNGLADDARDIFQEAMIVLYEKARSGDFELNCQIRTYLYSVSRRLWLKRLQQLNRYSSDLVSTDNVVAVEDDLEEHNRRDAEFDMMNKAMGNLGEPCKSLLEAFYLKKKNMQEIATDFGYTNSENAKTQKYKCLVRLKKLFFSHYKK
ncbi:RNA polymerase sigma factor [Terrimonas ferruginea]|uniref:RNA polymerase sigma factor n=1 Tax=Terrimonas ferruginea TaxID=249 RepID=UPI00040AF832|nr:sigma-70 family RNA polymerase sigma factor [Terrimonas ferruginea]